MGDKLQKVFNAYLADFNEIYPNINVETQFIGGYDDVRDQLTTEISSGNSEVNVTYCYPDHVASYNKANSVVSLDQFIYSDEYGFTTEERQDFIDAYYNEGQCFGDGVMYALPFSKSSEVMYYNKTFFDENNLEVPDHWFASSASDVTSMEYVCKKIKEIDNDSIPLGYDSGSNWFITMCAQMNTPYTSATGQHYLFNTEENRNFVSTFASWAKQGLVTTKDVYGSYTSGLFTNIKSETTKQVCYMCIGSSAGASYQQPNATDGVYPFEVDIARIPQMDENNRKVISQGPDVCILKNSDPQKMIASWLFIKYFTTNALFQAEFSMNSGYTPVIKSAFEVEAYKNFLAEGANGTNIQALSTSICVEQEADYFTSPAFVGSSDARTQVGNIITATFTGTDVNTAFADAIAKLND
jgi:multiple sugar transport system substrate-binding protein